MVARWLYYLSCVTAYIVSKKIIENGISFLGNNIRMIMRKGASCFRVPIAFSHAERERVGSLDDGATMKFLDAAIIMTRKRKMMKIKNLHSFFLPS